MITGYVNATNSGKVKTAHCPNVLTTVTLGALAVNSTNAHAIHYFMVNSAKKPNAAPLAESNWKKVLKRN